MRTCFNRRHLILGTLAAAIVGCQPQQPKLAVQPVNSEAAGDVADELDVDVLADRHHVGDGEPRLEIERGRHRAAAEIEVDQQRAPLLGKGGGDVAGDRRRAAAADGGDEVDQSRPAHVLSASDHTLEAALQALLFHRDGDELLDAQVHRVHQQPRLDLRRHREEVGIRQPLEQRRQDLERACRIRIEVDDHQRRRVDLEQGGQLVDRFNGPIDADALFLEERGHLLRVGWIGVDDDGTDLNKHDKPLQRSEDGRALRITASPASRRSGPVPPVRRRQWARRPGSHR